MYDARRTELHAQAAAIVAQVEAEGRDLTPDEMAAIKAASDEFDRLQLQHELVEDFRAKAATLVSAGRRTTPDALPEEGGGGRRLAVPGMWGRAGHGAGLRGPFTSMYANDSGGDMRGFKSAVEFFAAALSGKWDPRLRPLNVGTGQYEHTGSLGGYLVPAPVSDALMDEVFQDSILLPLVRRLPLTGKTTTYPRFAFADRSVGLLGGFQGEWLAEGAVGTLQAAQIEALAATAKKLAIFAKASQEMVEDAPLFVQEFQPALRRAIAYSLDRALVRGTGAGQPLGLTRDPAMIVVAPESGQAADTFNFLNATKMFSAMYPAGLGRAVWLAGPSVVPQLVGMKDFVRNDAGTVVGGEAAAKMGDGGQLTLLGRPILVTEHLAPLGDLGDVLFVDLSQYGFFPRREVYVETSSSPHWSSVEIDFRCILRADGMGLWATAGKRPGDALPTESWIVGLGAR